MNPDLILVLIILISATPMQIQGEPIEMSMGEPMVYETLLERILVLTQGDDVSMLTYARNRLKESCGSCNYTWKKEESFALKDPLTGCRVYMGLSKIDAELVSRQIEKIFESDQPQLIRTSVIRQF